MKNKMIVGAGRKLKRIRTVLSNDVNEIFVCQDVSDENSLQNYILIRISDSSVIKNVLETIYDNDGNCKLPQNLFCDLFVEVDKLNILMKYHEPQKMFSYLKSYIVTDYAEHMVIKNFLYKCLLLDVPYPILDLMLEKDNINIDQDWNIWFNCFLDFSKFDKNITQAQCVKKCCDLINDILMVNESLTEKSQVKSINLFIKKRRNNAYSKIIELYNDFKIKEKNYKNNKENIFKKITTKTSEIIKYKLVKILVVVGAVLIFVAIIVLICNLLKIDLPFSKYNGLNIIGTVDFRN